MIKHDNTIVFKIMISRLTSLIIVDTASGNFSNGISDVVVKFIFEFTLGAG